MPFMTRLTLRCTSTARLSIRRTSISRTFSVLSQVDGHHHMYMFRPSKVNPGKHNPLLRGTRYSRVDYPFMKDPPSVLTVSRQVHQYVKPALEFMNITTHGTEFRVGYTDEGPRDGPIILALHGVPGSTYDFDTLFQPLLAAGNRILTINFPGHGITKPGLNFKPGGYDETTLPKTEFVFKCMEALEVKSVDCLIFHSAAAHTALNIAANTNLTKSLAFLCPIGIRPHIALRPFIVTKVYNALLENEFCRPLASLPLKMLYSMKEFSIEELDKLLIGMSVAARLDFSQAEENSKKIAAKQLPFVAVMSKQDKLVELDISLDTARLCGVSEENISYLDLNGEVISGPSIEDAVFPKAFVFQGGGHFLFKKYPSQVGKTIVKLISRL